MCRGWGAQGGEDVVGGVGQTWCGGEVVAVEVDGDFLEGFDLSCTGWGGLCFRVGFFVGIVGVGWSFRGTKAAVGSGG